MSSTIVTELPADFVEQVHRLVAAKGHDRNFDMQDAILELIGRPLTGEEKVDLMDRAIARSTKPAGGRA